ncbi:MAG TPA: T9SS type A sorting domain-containing protein [Chitinophagaceae bacterium]|nr:T9SS type A sorting domain-containing protein [Chitinophagaceae bacterium]
MKKILLSTVLFVLAGVLTNTTAQGPASCPEITNFFVNPVGGSGTQWKVDFDYRNVTSGNKNIKVFISCNGSLVYTSDCIQVPQSSSTIVHYTSPDFFCSSLSQIEVIIETWVGNACGGTSCSKLISIGGGPLPVTFKSFNATRNKANVILRWETASEQNSRGFDVQRFIGSGNWESIGFVSSKAINGISSSALSYDLTDINNTKGVSQYRVLQLDLDGKSSFSSIRSVRGDGQTGKTIVYPNPSNNGKANIVFEDGNTTRDIKVSDMNGRTIRQWQSVTNNNIQLENLNAGFYTVKILNRETGEQTIEKLIVNKR